ncbi:glycosyltransferase [Ectobacillus sp. sgz5001026]|uniref:glycosyltransferase n=1 Tax=Ectobacillus sp. sgz5001026 TaxID=3242473 RepID=UPI0036D256CC
MFIMIVLSLLIGILLFHNITDCTRAKPLIHVKQVSIIMSTRNEERNIERLLQSIKQQMYPCVELIVCDDHSTASIAFSLGAKVIRLPTVPTGWLGKAWGCYNGAKEASGDVLMFVDADTILQPSGLHRMLSIIQHSRKTMLTVHPYHEMK